MLRTARTRRRLLAVLAAGIVAAAGLAILPVANAAPAGYSVHGIDVSVYQDDISWSSVAASGVTFAYARASLGSGYTDPTFDANHDGARANGLFFGAYHFARPDQSGGRAQADYFLDRAQYANDGRTLPPMLDIEWSTQAPTCFGLSPSQMGAWIQAFVDRVRERTGRLAMIYTNPNWWNPCVGTAASLGQHPLAHSCYCTSPGTLPHGWSRFTIWQYTSTGSVPGVSGTVDQDVFNGSLADLAALAVGRLRAAPAMGYDDGDGTMTIHRWSSTGTGFGHSSDYTSGSFSLSRVGDRVAAGDVDGDGDDDIVMAYQNGDGSSSLHVFRNGLTWSGVWYAGGRYDLGRVAGRLVVGDFSGDGRAEPAMVYDDGDGTMTIHRWVSTGTGFSHTSDYTSGSFSLSRVGDRVAAADVDGDGDDDIAMAYQNSDGTASQHVFRHGLTWSGIWYTGGQYNLDRVAGRLILGAW